MGLFYFFDSKEIYLIRQHIPRKNFNLYFSAGFIFILNLIFVFTIVAFADQISAPFRQDIRINVTFGIIFGISALISLVSIGIYRYAKYKIDLALYLRRHGKTTDELKSDLGKTTDELKSDLGKATSSLADNADSK
jgi:hypothetical protein